MTSPLPRIIVRIVGMFVRKDRFASVLADLADDYRIACRGSGARLWLIRETASLCASYGAAHITNLRSLAPLVARDCRLVLRALRRGRVASAAAAAMLAVGLAAVLLTVGLADAMLRRHVSSVHGPLLKRVAATDAQGRTAMRFSFPELQHIKDRVGDSADVGAAYLHTVMLRAQNTDLQTLAEIVDGPYLSLTGARPLIGRSMLAADHLPGAPPVAVIATPTWRRVFASSPNVLGSTITLNGASYTVVGVADLVGSSSSMGASVDAWVPLAHADPMLNRGWRTSWDDRWFSLFALPKNSAIELDARLQHATEELSRLNAPLWRDRRLHAIDATMLVGGQRRTMMILTSVLAGMTLLIMCAAAANVSGLMLARASSERRAAAVHLAVGGARAALVRRHLIEGALLGVSAGALGIGLYAWIRVQLAEIALLPTLSLRLDLPLTFDLIVIALGAGTAVGMLLSVAPAVWAMRVDVADVLRGTEGRTGETRKIQVMRRGLVSAQVCLSLVLVIGAAVLSKSLNAMLTAEVGFEREGLVAMDFDVEPSHQTEEQLGRLARQALTRVGTLPQVVSAAMANRAPVDESTPAVELRLPGSDQSISDVSVYAVTDGYFDTVGIPLVAGRPFREADVTSMADVAIVNEALADRFWPDGDALQRAVYLPAESRTLRVIGIARNSKYRSITEAGRPHLYRPTPPALRLTLLARLDSDPREGIGAIQRELDQIGPGLVGFFPRTFADHVAVQLLPTRAAAAVATLLGTLAMVWSAVALYGLISWFVVLRRREIGVRMALGATAADIRRLVLRQALSAAAPGMVVGLGAAMGLGFVVRGMLYGVGSAEPIAIGVGCGVLFLIIIAGAYAPSRRATAVAPATTLRS